jgi:hypothetical protein
MARRSSENLMNTPSSRVPTRGKETALHGVHIQILHVPDCPLVDGVRRTLERCISTTDLDVNVEELEGPYPSPTVIINGADPTGRPAPSGASCRLDVPTEEQIMAGLNSITRKLTSQDGAGQADSPTRR